MDHTDVNRDNTSMQDPKSRFRATDPNLPFIAANAASELDNVLHKRQTGTDNVEKLSLLLRHSIIPEGPGTSAKSLMDPLSTDVFSREYALSYKHDLTSLEELATKTVELSKGLSEPTNGTSKKETALATMRDFCIALSRYAMSKRDSIYGSRMKHPYRK